MWFTGSYPDPATHGFQEVKVPEAAKKYLS